ncbi:MAG TPA: cation:proton antiporter subunit C [Bacillota bacterium]
MATALDHAAYWLTSLLLLVGLYGMLFKPNLLRKLMAMAIFQNAVILFYVGGGVRRGGTPPVLLPELADPARYINPLPHVLMLTAIVVSVASTGVGLALLLALYRAHGTLDERVILAEQEGVQRES